MAHVIYSRLSESIRSDCIWSRELSMSILMDHVGGQKARNDLLVSVIACQAVSVRRTAILPGTDGVALFGSSHCLQHNKKDSKSNQPPHCILAVPVRYPSQTC